MALTKVLTGGLALDAVDNTILKLDDNYALTGTVTGVGTHQLLSSQTASNSTGVIFNSSLITNAYDNYLLMGSRISAATDTAHPLLFYSIDNGTSFDLDTSSARFYLRLQGAASGHEQENLDTSIQRIGSSSSNVDVETGQFFIYLQGFRSSTQKTTHGTYTGTHSGGASDGYSWRVGARIVTTSPINYVKFDFSAGNFDGNFSLYGITS